MLTHHRQQRLDRLQHAGHTAKRERRAQKPTTSLSAGDLNRLTMCTGSVAEVT
jgi:hypothetical protein